MRRILLPLFVFAAFAVNAQTVIVSEDFEAMNDVESIPGQSDDFESWSCNDYGPDAVYTNTEQASSGTKSMKISEASTTDMVLVLGPYTSDFYEINWKMYVPSGSGAYFNIMHVWTCNANVNIGEWAVDVFFHDNGQLDWIIEGTPSTSTLPYPHDEWFDVNANIDLTNDIANITIASNPTLQWQWSIDNNDGSPGTNQLNAVNFYGTSSDGSADGLYYVDDITVEMTSAVSVADAKRAELQVYPNPANDRVTISGDFNNSNMRILDLTGKLVKTSVLNGTQEIVATQDIPQGIYLIEIENGGQIETRKLAITH